MRKLTGVLEGDAEGFEVGNEVLPSTPPMVRMREAATAYLVILIHVLPLSPNRLVSQYDRIWLSLSCPCRKKVEPRTPKARAMRKDKHEGGAPWRQSLHKVEARERF